jgi:hypothetical protein
VSGGFRIREPGMEVMARSQCVTGVIRKAQVGRESVGVLKPPATIPVKLQKKVREKGLLRLT